MDSRERVRRAINFEKPDRVPIDLGSMRASGISATVYAQLKARLGLEGPTKILDRMQLLAEVEPEVMEACHIDVVPLESALARWCQMPASAGTERTLFSGVDVRFDPEVRIREETDGSWVLLDSAREPYARMPAGGFYFDFVRPTMSHARIIPENYQPSHTVSDEELDAFAKRAEFLYDNTDKAILGWGASISFFGLSALLSDNITQGSLDEWLCMLMTDKGAAAEMMGRATDAAIARAKLFHQAAGDKIMIWGVASDDAGTQRAALIRPDVFREMILPHYKRFNDWVHQNTGWKTFLHSCGSVDAYIEDWIQSGIDILNPVQISAQGMGAGELMDRFGGRIVFWGGGCDTQNVLPHGNPEDVRTHVRDNIKTFSGGPCEGGFVFTQVHNIQADVPVENVAAMLEAAYEFGQIDG